eukprot:scaffold3199_cov165-Amphora_coffeaeformis.AAC.5
MQFKDFNRRRIHDVCPVKAQVELWIRMVVFGRSSSVSVNSSLTLFCLSTKTIQRGDAPWNDDKTVLYALSTGEEAYSTAQERTLARLRDTAANASNELATDLIAAAPEVEAQMTDMVPTQAVASTAASSTVASLGAPRAPQKATTAAAFFGKKDDKKNSNAKPASSSQSSSQSKTAIKPVSNSMFRKASAKAKASTSKSPPDEKENNKRPEPVGNADDFVGDEEESDEEMEDEVPQQKPAVVRGRAPRPKEDDQIMIADEVEEEEENDDDEKSKAKPTIYGAMDDFAKPKEPSQESTSDANKRRRRRKRLVEKTTMDKDGYLHTEKQEIWEDIPTDEEDEEVAKKSKPAPGPARPKKSTVKAAGMKQGNLMGFFSKKK